MSADADPTIGEKLRDILTPDDAGPAVRAYFERIGRQIDQEGGATIDLDGLAPALAEDLPAPADARWQGQLPGADDDP